MRILSTRWVRNLILIAVGTICIILDGAFLDLFPSLIFYLALEYLWFESGLDVLRVMIILTFHSVACFGNIRIVYVVLFALHESFLLWRELFLKPFVPFVIYLVTICFICSIMGSYWIGAVAVTLVALSLWRGKVVEKI